MSNDQQTPVPPTTDESLADAVAHAHKKLEQPAIWPGNVPSQTQALEVLCGKRMLAISLPNARRLQEKLTLPEREALMDEGLADSLREAVAVRWRLAAAQDLLLTAGGRVDRTALEALLAEVDRSLETLRAATPATPDLGLAIDRTWETLTQEAVDFSTNVKAAAAQTAAPAHPHPAPKKPAATGKVTFQPQEPDPRNAPKKSNKVLFVGLGLAVALVAAYHGTQGPNTVTPPSAYTQPGAPPDTVVIPNASNGSLLVRSLRTGPATPQQEAWFKQQEASGMELNSQGPGTWLLVPTAKAPATAGNTQP
ncbi:hypothetical protein [Archangium violaceum]|uniref:Uncharacterized protein n=1 Tax=Archangium violaceum Cb vi76 TaxID=1406225 RepID=A0A084SIC0_9BACT|nr:hypothetical protein [Archangium violaceum]KFA88205.1 hypothetical protein Q664_42545 [Archangium violaceum Cb vi76]